MIFLNLPFFLFYSMTFMSGAKESVLAQKSIGDLVSNAGWSTLTDVNSITYENKNYGVNDLMGIEDDEIRTNVAMLLLGCSYASTLMTVLSSYKNIISSCLEEEADEEKFKRCTVDILQSLIKFDGLLNKIEKALSHVNDLKNRYETQVINTKKEPTHILGNTLKKIKTFSGINTVFYYRGRSERETNFNVFNNYSVLYTLDEAEIYLKKDIESAKCNLQGPEDDLKSNGWRQNVTSKTQNNDSKHLIEELDEIISSASLAKFTNLGFVDNTTMIKHEAV